MASEVAARQHRFINQILKGGWYLLRLINEILDLAMTVSGKVTMSQKPMSITAVLKDCEGMIEPQAAKRGVAMTFPGFDQIFYVHADRTRVKQVMINLLSNAINDHGSGGSVIVQCVDRGAGRVRICVKDTGCGLSADQLGHVFSHSTASIRKTAAKGGGRCRADGQDDWRRQRFTKLSSDWYREQDAGGNVTQCSGAVQEMLGISENATAEDWATTGWNVTMRAAPRLRTALPLDFGYGRAFP